MPLPVSFRELEMVRWLRASPWGTLRLRARVQATGGTRAYVYPGVYLHAARGVRLSGGGQLFWGRRWRHRRFYPGELGLEEGASVHVEDLFSFHTGFSILVAAAAKLHLGGGYMNNHGTIDCAQSVSIGHRVFISSHVTIRDTDFHRLDPSRPATAPVVIADNVWIGEGAKIMKGVTIGAGALVAAGALVSRDVPARTLVGGVPARVLRENVSWQ